MKIFVATLEIMLAAMLVTTPATMPGITLVTTGAQNVTVIRRIHAGRRAGAGRGSVSRAVQLQWF